MKALRPGRARLHHFTRQSADPESHLHRIPEMVLRSDHKADSSSFAESAGRTTHLQKAALPRKVPRPPTLVWHRRPRLRTINLRVPILLRNIVEAPAFMAGAR